MQIDLPDDVADEITKHTRTSIMACLGTTPGSRSGTDVLLSVVARAIARSRSAAELVTELHDAHDLAAAGGCVNPDHHHVATTSE